MDYLGTPFIDHMEQGTWSKLVGPTINVPSATDYALAQNTNGLTLVMFSQVAYAGWLAKHVVPVTTFPTHYYFEYMMVIDNPTTMMAQVAETDIKSTDALGWTYDNSAQWNIAENWMLQVGNPWVDTTFRMPPPNPYTAVFIALEQIVDTVNHQSRIASFFINRVQTILPVHWVAASQPGWAINEIVVQLQQVNNNYLPGGYALHFNNMALTNP